MHFILDSQTLGKDKHTCYKSVINEEIYHHRQNTKPRRGSRLNRDARLSNITCTLPQAIALIYANKSIWI